MKKLLTLFFIFGLIVGCTYPENNSKIVQKAFAETDKLILFKLPADGDPHLLNKELIPDGSYKLTSIQTQIQYWPSNTAITFTQSFTNPGKIAGDEKLLATVTNLPAANLTINFNLKIMLDYQLTTGRFAFGDAQDYWAQISTNGSSQWGLGKGDPANPSIYQIISITTGKPGTYSIVTPSQSNTVFLVKEDDGSITIYLKRLMQYEADYVKLSYKKDI